MSIINQQAVTDARKVLTGKDGCLIDDNGNLLATVESFQTQYNFTNAKYQPLGDMQEHEAAQSYSVSLTFSQIMIEDDLFFRQLVQYTAEGKLPEWNFQGMVQARNGKSEERVNYRGCIPTGSIDIQNLSVGDIIKRSWSFTVNEPPELQSWLTMY